jgi:hypothetical protein
MTIYLIYVTWVEFIEDTPLAPVYVESLDIEANPTPKVCLEFIY